MGWEVKNDRGGEFEHAVWVCKVKIGKFICQELLGHISQNFQITLCGINWFQLCFSKMVKLEENYLAIPKLVISKTFQNYHVCAVPSLFDHFWSQFLTDFDIIPLKAKLMTSTRIWNDFGTRGPTRHLKMVKTCSKIPDIDTFMPFLSLIWPGPGWEEVEYPFPGPGWGRVGREESAPVLGPD